METISFPTIVTKAGSRRCGMCCVCLTERDRKRAVNSAGVQNVCARSALTDSPSNKQQLQGTVIILRHFFHIQFRVVCMGDGKQE